MIITIELVFEHIEGETKLNDKTQNKITKDNFKKILILKNALDDCNLSGNVKL